MCFDVIKQLLQLIKLLVSLSPHYKCWCCEQGSESSCYLGAYSEAGMTGKGSTRMIHQCMNSLEKKLSEHELDEEKNKVENYAMRIGSNMMLLKKCYQHWTELLRGMMAKENVKEKQEFVKFADGDGGYNELLFGCKEVFARLRGRVTLIAQKRELLQLRKGQHSEDLSELGPVIEHATR